MNSLRLQLQPGKFTLPVILILFAGINGSFAQCTFQIPALSGHPGSSNYNYYGTTVYRARDTTESYYPTHYNWVCAGDTVNFPPDPVNNNQQCCGCFILEKGAALILSSGGADWTIYAKSGATFINLFGNCNNVAYADSDAIIGPNSAGCYYGPIVYCSPLVYDYSLITPGMGCQTTAPAPTAQFGANSLNVCTGSSVNFSDSSIGSPTAWNWTFKGGTPGSSTSQNPVVTYDTSGIFDVKLVATNASGSDSLTKSGYITVNAYPLLGTVIASPDSICAGNASNLVVNGSTGSIQWQSATTPPNFSDIAGAIDTAYATPPLSRNTEYRIVATSRICSDTSAPLLLKVDPLPAPPTFLTSDSLICSSDSAKITAIGGPYSTYHWNTGDTANYTYAHDAGNYWVTVADANNCSIVSGHQSISVYPVPSVSIDVLGDTLTAFNAVSYQWLSSDTFIPGATSSFYVATQTGSYSVQITDTNGCTAISSPKYINVGSGIIEPGGNNSLSVYPDPFTNTIFIKSNDQPIDIERVEIFNVLGEIVVNKKIAILPTTAVPVDVSMLPEGAYLVRIKTVKGDYQEKIVKE